ncbi:WXG100 family type VII secretion target [Angustibacter luteus]|uniref:ESAT-6-like protein n=1 Tax=Angustibacter luteus TaxID=658456 RepID=A0ABW1JCT7_9ACTN
MSSQFQVDTDRISGASGTVQRIGADIDSAVSRMTSELTALQDAWRGEASGRFHAVAVEWRGTQVRVREALDHIGQLLAQAGQQYAAAEQQNAAMFR